MKSQSWQSVRARV